MLFDLVGRDIRLALSFLVLLNVNLAILNLLPIPVLDGGHIMFTLLEWVRKKPLNYKLMEAIQSTFVILLLGFILYVTFNDGKRWARTKGWLHEKQAPAQQAPATPAPAPAK
jgi:regulator of sigma E protease